MQFFAPPPAAEVTYVGTAVWDYSAYYASAAYNGVAAAFIAEKDLDAPPPLVLDIKVGGGCPLSVFCVTDSVLRSCSLHAL